MLNMEVGKCHSLLAFVVCHYFNWGEGVTGCNSVHQVSPLSSGFVATRGQQLPVGAVGHSLSPQVVPGISDFFLDSHVSYMWPGLFD